MCAGIKQLKSPTAVHSLHQLLWLSWNVKACVLRRPDSIPSSFYPLRLCCLIFTWCFLLMEHCCLSESHHTRFFICYAYVVYCGVVLQMWMQLLGFKKGSVSHIAFSPLLGCVVDTCVPLRVSLFSVETSLSAFVWSAWTMSLLMWFHQIGNNGTVLGK